MLHQLVVRLVVMYVLINSPDAKDTSLLIPIKYERVLATRLRGWAKCSVSRLGST